MVALNYTAGIKFSLSYRLCKSYLTNEGQEYEKDEWLQSLLVIISQIKQNSMTLLCIQKYWTGQTKFCFYRVRQRSVADVLLVFVIPFFLYVRVQLLSYRNDKHSYTGNA